MTDRPEPTDGDLAAAALADGNAYAALVIRHEAALARHVRRLLGPAHAAATDDILQDSFVRAYVNLRDYDRSRPFAPWLWRIAHNLAISHLRRQKAQPQPLTGEDAALLIDRLADPSSPQAALDAHRRDAAVRTCLGRLEPRYREVIALRFLDEKSYGDIGDILRLPAGTVATLIRRGLARLRPLLAAAGLDEGGE